MKRIIIGLIILSGLFIFKGLERPCYDAQFSLLVLSFFAGGGYLLFKENKWLGYMAWLYGVVFLKTFLFNLTPYDLLFKEVVYAMSIFGVYYTVKRLRLSENILKWFLIPLFLNCLVIVIQVFDNGTLFTFPEAVSGFLGNIGLTGCYLAIGLPIVFKYQKKWAAPYILCIILTRSITAIVAVAFITMLYFYHSDRKLWRVGLLVLCVIVLLFCINSVVFEQGMITIHEDIMQRACMWVATMDSIRFHPVTGWGIGRFTHIMKQIPEEKSYYLGRAFNERDYKSKDPNKLRSYMNHPHNEVLYNMWMMGVGFLIIFIGLFRNLKRKFTVKKLLPFSILLGGFIVMMGHFLSAPAWILVMMSLGIFENRRG